MPGIKGGPENFNFASYVTPHKTQDGGHLEPQGRWATKKPQSSHFEARSHSQDVEHSAQAYYGSRHDAQAQNLVVPASQAEDDQRGR